MVRRAREGVVQTNYKQVDYDQMKQLIAEKKYSGREALMKFKKIETAARVRKDENLVKQHLNAWNRELSRLESSRRQLQVELEALVAGAMYAGGDLQEIFEELESIREAFDVELASFAEKTTDPVWQLRF